MLATYGHGGLQCTSESYRSKLKQFLFLFFHLSFILNFHPAPPSGEIQYHQLPAPLAPEIQTETFQTHVLTQDSLSNAYIYRFVLTDSLSNAYIY